MKKENLISELIKKEALKTQSVIEAFMKIPRENFVIPEHKKYSYVNYPLPIPEGQTISQPYTVAVMTEALQVKKDMKILEVGAGSGYQAAILSLLVGPKGKVITTERIEKLFEFAKENLKDYKNVTVVKTDGSKGYQKEAPYDRILVAASAREIPPTLIKQLKDKGIMIIPVGNEMYTLSKRQGKITRKFMGYFSFVPLIED